MTESKKQIGSYKTLTKALEEQVSHHRRLSERYQESIKTMQSERDANAILTDELTETRDLAEQRRVELGECRKDAERLDWLIASGARVLQEDDGFYLFWHTSYRETQRQVSPRAAIDAAMEAKP